MKYPENTKAVAALLPDYLGFIFWEKSPRNFVGDIPELPETIKKVGVFVDASEDEIAAKCSKYKLDFIQLHGSESVAFCKSLKRENIGIIKAFSIGNDFDFGILSDYEPFCDFFLFDAPGRSPGGNGISFDWELLRNYDLETPLFLSGGIAPESAEAIKNVEIPIFAIDINSKFEIEPGLKNIDAILTFKTDLK